MKSLIPIPDCFWRLCRPPEAGEETWMRYLSFSCNLWSFYRPPGAGEETYMGWLSLFHDLLQRLTM